jgi:hypothetical protein
MRMRKYVRVEVDRGQTRSVRRYQQRNESNAHRIHQDDVLGNPLCPIDFRPVTVGGIRCERCHVLYHRECFEFVGVCTTPGCHVEEAVGGEPTWPAVFAAGLAAIVIALVAVWLVSLLV